MIFLIILLYITQISTSPPKAKDTSQLNDYKIACAVRKAVRQADSTLLNDHSLTGWRDYPKVAALDLQSQLQPLVLIKFDEDVSFRNQLKTIIRWENQWRKRPTEHFIYYYRWDKPPPEIILEVQDAHFNELANLFQIETSEKIPFRYDLDVDSSIVYPYDDLRGGIVSPQPFDLKNGALALLYFLNSEPVSLLAPLSKIYGSYFQNPSTSQAYYLTCAKELSDQEYISALNLYKKRGFESSECQEWYSAYLFVYELDQKFGPAQIAQFLSKISIEMTEDDFLKTFNEIFEMSLPEFENNFRPKESVKKM